MGFCSQYKMRNYSFIFKMFGVLLVMFVCGFWVSGVWCCVSSEGAVCAVTVESDERSIDAQVMVDMSSLLLSEATQHLGERYVFGGMSPGRFDCSGFVEYCYKTALGITPKRIAGGRVGGAQYQYNGCAKIYESEVAPGDLVFFGGGPQSISHVGIYVSPDRMINAMNSRKGVCYTSISKFKPRFVGYGRVDGFGEAQMGMQVGVVDEVNEVQGSVE
jgi:hypothetical protein